MRIFAPAFGSGSNDNTLDVHAAARMSTAESLLFVAQSPARGGVDTVLDTLFREWPSGDPRRRVLVCNSGHGGLLKFRRLEAEGFLDLVVLAPIWDPAPQFYAGSYPPLMGILVRAAYRLALPILNVWGVLYFAALCRRLNVTGLFSHNGGYPGGPINRVSVLGAWFARVKKRYHVIHGLARPPTRFFAHLTRIFDRAAEKAATAIVTGSAASASSLVSKRGFSHIPMVVHYGVAACANQSPSLVRDRSCRRTNFSIGFVGRLVPQKGLHILLDALARLPAAASLHVYGEGNPEYLGELQCQAAALRVGNRVEFAGYVLDLTTCLREMDVVVTPSIGYENFPLVVLEAMQIRLPVIVSDVGGMPEIVKHDVTGFIVPERDSEALAAAILRLMNDRDLAARLGDAGYARLVAEFPASKMVSRYFELVR